MTGFHDGEGAWPMESRKVPDGGFTGDLQWYNLAASRINTGYKIFKAQFKTKYFLLL